MENKQCGEIRKEKKEKKKAKATNKYGECRNSPVPKTVELVDLPSRERKRKTGARIYRMVEGVWSDINKVVFFVVVVGIVVVCCPRESPVVVVRRHTHTHTTSELVIVSYKSAIHWALENGRRRSHRPLQSSSSFFSLLFTRTNSLDVRQIASAFLSLPTQTKEKQPHDLPKATAPGIIDEGPPTDVADLT